MKVMKIYGMRGLLEWHGTVHSNGIKMKVDFTNGSVTAYGVAPATFITKDTLTQHIMENSDEFKSGRIRLERTVPLPGEVDERVVEPTKTEPNGSGNGNEGSGSGNDEEDNGSNEGEEDNGSGNGNEGSGKQKVEVADKAEAIEWLKEYNPGAGYTATKLRLQESFDAACADCNVEFVFNKRAK